MCVPFPLGPFPLRDLINRRKKHVVPAVLVDYGHHGPSRLRWPSRARGLVALGPELTIISRAIHVVVAFLVRVSHRGSCTAGCGVKVEPASTGVCEDDRCVVWMSVDGGRRLEHDDDHWAASDLLCPQSADAGVLDSMDSWAAGRSGAQHRSQGASYAQTAGPESACVPGAPGVCRLFRPSSWAQCKSAGVRNTSRAFIFTWLNASRVAILAFWGWGVASLGGVSDSCVCCSARWCSSVAWWRVKTTHRKGKLGGALRDT